MTTDLEFQTFSDKNVKKRELIPLRDCDHLKTDVK